MDPLPHVLPLLGQSLIDDAWLNEASPVHSISTRVQRGVCHGRFDHENDLCRKFFFHFRKNDLIFCL